MLIGGRSPARTASVSACRRRSVSGWRARRYRAQDSVAAVVSIPAARRLSTTRTRSLAEVLEVQRAIHDAVLAGDEARASSAVETHLTETRDILISQIVNR
ncbi:DNA-binding GntR family transcriptional regulator [Saccharopolyspora phatthalungensis]|uniref:DNA-binding GntR family transcriptional regulator n=1 Tax=Saccharopolyspora phatthalungensis TaxID=664693 RepID=A0A840QA18_9PSEU|nr:hypothetical protein [Saccharopolyspora phatthalungensis]MBB5159382.1 DNA-binding GntR family transcriptional regulator [Saccharopolyspora phatthalungensis]